MHYKYPVVLTIAGSDSSGGAGIQADIKTMTVLKCYAVSVITAITAQNTTGVQDIFPVPKNFIEKQLDSVFRDLKIDAVKIGMLHNADVIEIVTNKLTEYSTSNIILDPVMASTSGEGLMEEDAILALKEKFFVIASLVTPNIFETEKLAGIKINSESDMIKAGNILKKI